ncbi:endogenous retrovirus group K member 113 Gag polyprotein-like [Rattus norvegicus]|uniref:endogenous retrovirus group K member 113 Gag polyprotein-like n=1 Tax=Rattus norvegicus TaxID=10116 RepID=UPI001916D048|nr:endogenous retrovirus group K member 113 Gag polyprotein-like [Rattus norvegicus]
MQQEEQKGCMPYHKCLTRSFTIASWDKLGRDLDRKLAEKDLRLGTKAIWKLVKNCLVDDVCKAAVVGGQTVLEVVQDGMSETERSERLGTCKRKDVLKKKKSPPERKVDNRKLLPRQSPTVPPPYEARSCAFSLVPDRVRRKLRMMFPVFETQEGERVHAPVEYNQIKELAESVRKYGVTANFTLTILERLVLNYLTPADWQMIAKATLVNMGQYMEWKALWYEAAQTQARANPTALTPEQREWTFELLTGQGRFAADQANYHWGAYVQVSSSGIKAWKALTKKGGADNQLTRIIQGPQEPFSDFVARMTETAGRIFGDAEQAAPLIEQLVFEQATQECRAAIAPRKNKGLQDWLRVCRELGGPLTNAGLAAAILQSQPRPLKGTDTRSCFQCGKMGHLKRDCRITKGDRRPATICVRCGKGYHRPDRCRSVRDIKGKLLPPLEAQPNEMSKNGSLGPQSQGPQRYGNRFQKAMTLTEETPQEVTQNWTCVPPPTSF